MVELKCGRCGKRYLGHDDSEKGVPNVCCTCDMNSVDTSEIDPNNIPSHMGEHILSSGGEDGNE